MKTVLITGGSRGIGKAMVEQFSKSGAQVAFTYFKSENDARDVAMKNGALAIRADSKNEADIRRAVDEVVQKFGAVDVLINNAGISSVSLISDLSLSDWREIFSVNVDAAFLYTKCVLPEMIHKKSGRIINITSMWGQVGASCEVCYSASKAALIGFTKALAKELGPSGITVNAIAPGLIDTDMNSGFTSEDLAQVINETPLSRIGKAEDVACAAMYLASDAASFVTGAVINVNGGLVT